MFRSWKRLGVEKWKNHLGKALAVPSPTTCMTGMHMKHSADVVSCGHHRWSWGIRKGRSLWYVYIYIYTYIVYAALCQYWAGGPIKKFYTVKAIAQRMRKAPTGIEQKLPSSCCYECSLSFYHLSIFSKRFWFLWTVNSCLDLMFFLCQWHAI